MSPPKRRTAYQKQKAAASSRNARRTTCRKCGQPVYEGSTARVMSLTVLVEVYGANAVDEVLARGIGGRPSYELTRYGADVEIAGPRDRWTVLARPGVPALGGLVVLAHDCYERPRPEPVEQPALFDLDGPPPF